MDNNDTIENFTAITGANTEEAVQFMSCCDFNLESAVQLYFASHGGQNSHSTEVDERPGARRVRDDNLVSNGVTISSDDDIPYDVIPPQTTTQVTRMFNDHHHHEWQGHPEDALEMMMANAGMTPPTTAFSGPNHEGSGDDIGGDIGGPPKGIYSIYEGEFFPPEIQDHFSIIPGCSLPSYGCDGRYHFSPVSSSEVWKQNRNTILKALDNCCGVACTTKKPVFICILDGGNDRDSLFFCRDILQDEMVQCTLQAYCQCFFQVVNPTSEGLICDAEARLQSSRIANEAGVLNSIRKTNGESAYRDAQRAINLSELMAMYHLEHEPHRPIAFMIHPLTRAKLWPIQGSSLHAYEQDIQFSHPPSCYDTQTIVGEIVDQATRISKSAFSHDADDFFVREVSDGPSWKGPAHQSSSVANGGGPSTHHTTDEVASGGRVVEIIDDCQFNGDDTSDVYKKKDEVLGTPGSGALAAETGATIQLDAHLYLDETSSAKNPDGLKTIRIRTPTGVINLPCLPSLPLHHLFLFAASHIHKKKTNTSEAATKGGDKQNGSLYSFVESPSLVNFSATVQFLSGFPPKPMEIACDALSPGSAKTIGDCKSIRNGDIITPHSSG